MRPLNLSLTSETQSETCTLSVPRILALSLLIYDTSNCRKADCPTRYTR